MRSQTLELQALLTVPDLSNTPLVLGYQTSDGLDVRLEASPRYVLLETWELTFKRRAQETHLNQEQGLYNPTESGLSSSAMYNQCIPIFRALFTLLRTLPAWQIYKKCISFHSPTTEGVLGQSEQKQLGIKLRIRPTGVADKYENDIHKIGQLFIVFRNLLLNYS